jgi:hypothetical protein
MTPDQQLAAWRCAMHEAAHCAVAHALGVFSVVSVHIDRFGRVHGTCDFQSSCHDAAIALAGPVCGVLVEGRAHAAEDVHRVLCEGWHSISEEDRYCIGTLTLGKVKESVERVRSLWSLIERIAREEAIAAGLDAAVCGMAGGQWPTDLGDSLGTGRATSRAPRQLERGVF